MRRIFAALALVAWAASAAAQIGPPPSSGSATLPTAPVFSSVGTLNTSGAPPAPVSVIYDDDTESDYDSMYQLTALHHWIDTGAVNVLAFIGDGGPHAAPVYKIYNNYYGHNVPIGSATAGESANVTSSAFASPWAPTMIAKYDAGDVSSNYPSCVTLVRQILNNATSPVTYIATGMVDCLWGVANSPANYNGDNLGVTGATLVKTKISAVYMMGGYVSSGTPEFNWQMDGSDTQALFNVWTSQNGYPPIYINMHDDTNATNVVGIPAWFSQTGTGLQEHPAYYTAIATSTNLYRTAWDTQSIYQAIFGLTYYTQTPGTNTVAGTGVNTFSTSVNSGHIHVSPSQPDDFMMSIWDGNTHNGAAAFLPANYPGTATASAWQCGFNRCLIGEPLYLVGGFTGYGTFTNNVSTAAATTVVGAFFGPGMNNNQEATLRVGYNSTNFCTFGFVYKTTPANQAIGLGCYGVGDFLTIVKGAAANSATMGLNTASPTATFDDNGSFRLSKAYTTATAPTCNASATGLMIQVSDSVAAPAWGSTYSATGAASALLWCNGANWTVLGK